MPAATGALRAKRWTHGLSADKGPQLAPGTIVGGKYRIEAPIGEGGMGTVYRAEHLALRRSVALKVMRPELSADPQMAARFEREAFASSRISSPNVVMVHDFGKDDAGVLYLIMELLEGESLGVRLEREGVLPLGQALRIARDVARALEAAHRTGIVHRDLKPDNVFLSRTGEVKVLDFGIARLLEGASAAPASSNVTMTGMIVGTPTYMSPEAVSRQPVGPPTDLYALGVMLFEMIAGRPPFESDEAVLLMGMHITEPAPRLDRLARSVADKPGIVALVARLLEKSPEARGRTSDLVAALTELMARYGGDPSTTRLGERAFSVSAPAVSADRTWASSRGNAVMAAVGAALALLAVIGVGAVWALEQHRAARAGPIEASPATVHESESAPAPPSVLITLEGLPERARITTDGELGPDGAHVRFPRGAVPHAIEVEADGFVSRTIEVVPDADRTVSAALERVSPTGRAQPEGEGTGGGAPGGRQELPSDPRREL